uniref:Uncharacterized protein n=1 Tax=Strigamia maritima TaxID=126957 RepID=T1IYI7_STRMM
MHFKPLFFNLSNMKLVLLAALVTLCVLVVVSADGYGGGGYQTYMVPGGGGKRGRKWQIRAKGKGLQNMMPHYQHSGGGEKHYEKNQRRSFTTPSLFTHPCTKNITITTKKKTNIK